MPKKKTNKVRDLSPAPYNPRFITDEKLELLEKSLKEFGDLSGIVFNVQTGNTVGGHQRLKKLDPDWAIEKTKEDDNTGTVAVGYIITPDGKFSYREVDWEEVKEKAANIAANKHGGEWDFDKLKDMLDEIDNSNIDFDLTGFNMEEVESLLNDSFLDDCGEGEEDNFNGEPPKEPITVLGDLYELNNHRVLCGDSTNITDVEKLMNGEKADMVFTDPPYGVDYVGGHNKKKREGIKNDKLQGNDLSSLFEDSINIACLISKDNSPFYIWYGAANSIETYTGLSKTPIKVRIVICWYKIKSGLGAFMSQYIPNYEPCIYGYKEGQSIQWFGATDEKTVWELKRDQVNEFHPTQKPIELVVRAIKNSSKKDQSIFDCFLGSGSTLMASEQTKRKCYGLELAPNYCDVIVKRWLSYMKKENKPYEIKRNDKVLSKSEIDLFFTD